MYFFSVAAQFRNEALVFKEWIEHYLFHGAEHFYLIDDHSDDNSIEILQPYIDRGLVTIFQGGWGQYRGRQMDMYNRHFLPILKETRWLLMVDLDEFMWSPVSISIPAILHQCSHFGQIQVCHTIYGSNGHLTQPDSIVAGFTKRSAEHPSHHPVGNRKYFINSGFEFTSLNVHHANFEDQSLVDNTNRFICLGPEWFVLNHYCCQSKQFWNEIKCTRGDSDHYTKRTEADFDKYDLNQVEDLGLFQQNMSILSCHQEHS